MKRRAVLPLVVLVLLGSAAVTTADAVRPGGITIGPDVGAAGGEEQEAEEVEGRGAPETGPAGAVAVIVPSTAAAGALLSLLRERSGNLAAPVLLHLTANCAGPLAAAVSSRLERRGHANGGPPPRGTRH